MQACIAGFREVELDQWRYDRPLCLDCVQHQARCTAACTREKHSTVQFIQHQGITVAAAEEASTRTMLSRDLSRCDAGLASFNS